MPLLRKQLEVGRIEIDGLDLKLKQNAAGQGQLGGLGQRRRSPTSTDSSGPTSLESRRRDDHRCSRIAFEDLVAQKVNVDIGRIAPGAAIPVDLQDGAGEQRRARSRCRWPPASS